MNWVEALRNAIAYMEEHMMETISADQIAAGSGCCPGQLAKGFQIVTGYSWKISDNYDIPSKMHLLHRGSDLLYTHCRAFTY